MNTATEARDKGIDKAIKHANEVHEQWSETAYKFLLIYIKTNRSFMTEDVRYAALNNVPLPPSLRAWGGVIRRAAKGRIDTTR